MLPLLRSELFRLSRRAMPRILLGVLILIVVALYTLLWVVVRTDASDGGGSDREIAELADSLRLGEVRNTGLSFVYQFGALMVVILTASTVGSEFGSGTIRTILPRASGRLPFLLAKLAAMVLFTALAVLIGYVAGLGASAVVTSLEDLNGGFGPNVVLQTLAALGRTVFVMLPYLALAFAVAVWTRSTAAGIGVGLAVLFLEGLITGLIGLAGGAFDRIGEFLLAENVSAVLEANAGGLDRLAGPPSGLPGAWRAAAVLAVYTAVFLGLAFWRFARRDLTAGTGG